MSLLTVKQYAEQHQVSEQSVYGKIKRGTIDTTQINGITMIDTAPTTPDQTTSNDEPAYKQMLKQLKKQHKRELKFRDKQIRNLQKQLQVIQERYYNLTVLFRQQNQKQIEVIHDIEPLETKKKKVKKSKKK